MPQPPLTQGFDDITTLPGAGWVQTNHSTVVGTTSWFQGNSAVFPAQSGPPTSYIGANFNNTTGTNTISNWLLTPPLTLQNGATMTFYTRTVDVPAFPDRLQVRMSTNGASSNVGTTATDVGDFTTLLLDINPTLTTTGYPNVWTQFTVTVSGVILPTPGRLAFRYFVTNGGPGGANSDYIGIDTFAFNGVCGPGQTPTPSATASPSATPSATPTATVPPSPTPSATPSPSACVWTAGPVVPSPILDEPVVTVGNNLYTFAGVQNGAIVATSYKFDGTTWTTIAPLPTAVEFAAAVTDGTNIFILGGALTGTGTPQTTLYRYNVAANTYTTLAPFTTGTWNHAAAYLNGKIYKFAGTGPATASTNVLEIYDVASNTWTPGPAYPLAISFVSAFVQGNFIYGAGGIDSVTSTGSVKTFRYDPVANSWSDAAIADLPQTRWGAASSFYNNGGVLAGGYVNGSVTANISNTIISWDLVTNTWQSSLPNMLGERARMNGAVLGGCFYVVGGRSIASPAFVGTNDNQTLCCGATPSPTPTTSPTATATVSPTATATASPTATVGGTPTPSPCGTPFGQGFDDITTLPGRAGCRSTTARR